MKIKKLFGGANEMRIAPAPMYKCPMGDAPAQPSIIWNHQEKCWFMFYHQRNKHSVLREEYALSFIAGTDIGIASSSDNGKTWRYRGIAEGLNFEPGRNTWAMPEVVCCDGVYHLFCNYMQGYPTIRDYSEQDPSYTLHYTSKDLWHWEFYGRITEGQNKEGLNRISSPFVYRMPNGKWRMFYTDYGTSDHCMLESADLYSWKNIGKVKGVDHGMPNHSSINVFRLGGFYWMTIDTTIGYAVYRSGDCENWTKQEGGLLFGVLSIAPDLAHSGIGSISQRKDDGSFPHNSDVVELKDKAYLFYYTHPERMVGQNERYDPRLLERIHGEPHLRRSVIQVAELTVKDGKLYGKRDEPFDFYLPDMD